MTTARYKTMRHIETVRNYLNFVIRTLMERQERHDQSKMQPPEEELFEEYTDRLRQVTYGSDEYARCLEGMNVALTNHYAVNRHHPEHFSGGIREMNLMDLMEMLCDWKAATLRHEDGDLMKSIEINKARFDISDDLTQVLYNTAHVLENHAVEHRADES